MTNDFNVDRFYAQLGAFLFLLFHMIEGWHLDEMESHDLGV